MVIDKPSEKYEWSLRIGTSEGSEQGKNTVTVAAALSQDLRKIEVRKGTLSPLGFQSDRLICS